MSSEESESSAAGEIASFAGRGDFSTFAVGASSDAREVNAEEGEMPSTSAAVGIDRSAREEHALKKVLR